MCGGVYSLTERWRRCLLKIARVWGCEDLPPPTFAVRANAVIFGLFSIYSRFPEVEAPLLEASPDAVKWAACPVAGNCDLILFGLLTGCFATAGDFFGFARGLDVSIWGFSI